MYFTPSRVKLPGRGVGISVGRTTAVGSEVSWTGSRVGAALGAGVGVLVGIYLVHHSRQAGSDSLADKIALA